MSLTSLTVARSTKCGDTASGRTGCVMMAPSSCSFELAVWGYGRQVLTVAANGVPMKYDVPSKAAWTLWLLNKHGGLVGNESAADPAQLLESAAEPFTDYREENTQTKQQRAAAGRADYALLGYSALKTAVRFLASCLLSVT